MTFGEEEAAAFELFVLGAEVEEGGDRAVAVFAGLEYFSSEDVCFGTCMPEGTDRTWIP